MPYVYIITAHILEALGLRFVNVGVAYVVEVQLASHGHWVLVHLKFQGGRCGHAEVVLQFFK